MQDNEIKTKILAPLTLTVTAAGVAYSSDNWQVPNDVKRIIGVRLDSNFPERFVYGATIQDFTISGKQVVERGVIAKLFHNTQHGRNAIADKFIAISEFDKSCDGFLNNNNNISFGIIDNEDPAYTGAVFAPYTVKLTLYCELK
jgi:hypothetical protein